MTHFITHYAEQIQGAVKVLNEPDEAAADEGD